MRIGATCRRRRIVVGPAYAVIDSRYHSLIRIGGIALILTGVAYTVCLILTLAVPPSSGTAASYLQVTGPKAGLVTTLWATYMISDLLLVPALLALYIVLKERSRVLLLVGTAMVGGYLVFDIAITEPNWLALAALASGYASASILFAYLAVNSRGVCRLSRPGERSTKPHAKQANGS